jgi:hypothetical protein
MNQPPSNSKRHSFRPLLFAPPPSFARPPAGPLPAPVLPARASADDSHVRLRALPSPLPPAPRGAEIEWLDAQDLLDELCEDQITMSMNLACLERVVQNAPRDPSARAAFRTLEARIADLGALRDVLGAVASLTVERRFHRLFVPDAALADYLRGIYAWAHAVIRALDTLASSLRALQPDWALLRWRLEEAKNFHFDELIDAIRADVVRVSAVPRADELAYAVERLFATATALEERLDERFG